MSYYLIKISVTVILVIVISEVAKRSSLIGGVLASIPIISVLAILWLYIDTQDIEKVSSLASSVFWLVIPSLTLFISLPLLLKSGLGFYTSLTLSIGITIIAYFIMITLLKQFGITL